MNEWLYALVIFVASGSGGWVGGWLIGRRNRKQRLADDAKFYALVERVMRET